ncbi:atp-dependent clp protease [Holotrichia oblita]|nr:atp-dependent clp protease [Holotrichia oblita]
MEEASRMGHNYIGAEHILLGLINIEGERAYTILSKHGVEQNKYREALVANVGIISRRTELTPEKLTPHCQKLLETAIIKARMQGQPLVRTEHILTVLINEKDSVILKLLNDLGFDKDAIALDTVKCFDSGLYSGFSLQGMNNINSSLRHQKQDIKKSEGRISELAIYGHNLTDMAMNGELDPVIGRDAEVERVIQILSRRTKNNPCLIGEAGVGKTAIVERLSQMITEGNVPDEMLNKHVFALDLPSMIAGCKYRGDFEEKVKHVLEIAEENRDVILFIDELHTIVGAGAAEGAIDAANMLKPSLARSKIQIIGATTISEFRRRIEKDPALERRFQSVMVEPPNEVLAIEIMKGLRNAYESHHHLKISDEALVAAVTLSVQYIQDRYLPDKAIDLLDEAASYVRLKSNCDNNVLTKNDIARVVSKITGIEVEHLTKDKCNFLLSLEDRLSDLIAGQEEAISAVARAIRRGKSGLKDPNRPIGSFIFMGPTGVGKTELTNALVETMFAKKDALIRLDMSEYMEKHTVSKLIGSPPGYIGFDEGGQLTDKVRKRPYAVVLFDEVEKAHPDVLNILLQILEDGILTDSQGRKVSFKNTIVIMTTNLGTEKITERRMCGFASDIKSQESTIKKDVKKGLKDFFRPELINRVDEIIVFNMLNDENVFEIAERMLEKSKKRAAELGVSLEFTKNAIRQIAMEGYDQEYGARPLRRVIQKRIEDQLAVQLLHQFISNGDIVVCDYDKGFIFNIEGLADVS